jgi:phage terminase large subunit GpA-like protein
MNPMIEQQIDHEYHVALMDLIDSADHHISSIKPSDWVETNRMMTSDISPIPGYFSYKNSPYTREMIDCLAPDHPARVVAIMKGAQIGISTGLMEGGTGYIISENPGNILFLVGHADLVKDASAKIDRMIDNSGIRQLIKSVSMRARKTKSGDTDTRKDFAGGYLKLGIANHKTLRNISMQYGFIDDFESMQGDTKQSGSTEKMVEQRFAAYAKKQKLFYISTPELKETSNIEPVYLKGDQRKYHIPCPCCNELIVLEWECASKADTEKRAGITWQLDDSGYLIPESVGYVCQECGGFFDDRNKSDFIQKGKWIPTAKPSKPGYYSYHISALYAPVYMYGWQHYVREYMDANPVGGDRDQGKWKTFCNLVLGETYEQQGEQLNANELQQNIRPYEVGTIPKNFRKMMAAEK